MNKKGTITAVGLGPGDAELLTLKGYKALQNAGVIFYPASAVTEEGVSSFSLSILDQLQLRVRVEPLHIPMKSKEREQYYKEAFEKIKKEYDAGSNVVIVSEGDILFYSTFGYLWKYIQDAGLPCTLIPGIPAFIAGGSLGSQPLVEGTNPLLVISCPDSFEDISTQITSNHSLVIMKLSKLTDWGTFLENLKSLFIYCGKGRSGNPICNEQCFPDLAFRRVPYFSLLLIYG
ncbi:MAG: precorrin-2 C(20)-methyltransferase [Bacteroidales bacterium]|nr:precorrin-2 C(20)-methyltransferase [Bacteroidales bacterium]